MRLDGEAGGRERRESLAIKVSEFMPTTPLKSGCSPDDADSYTNKLLLQVIEHEKRERWKKSEDHAAREESSVLIRTTLE